MIKERGRNHYNFSFSFTLSSYLPIRINLNSRTGKNKIRQNLYAFYCMYERLLVVIESKLVEDISTIQINQSATRNQIDFGSNPKASTFLEVPKDLKNHRKATTYLSIRIETFLITTN